MLELYLQGNNKISNGLKLEKYIIILAVYKNQYKCILCSPQKNEQKDKSDVRNISHEVFGYPYGKKWLSKYGHGNGELWLDLRDNYEIEFLQFDNC